MTKPLITTRWRIAGEFTTLSPLHVGNGAITARANLRDKRDDSPCDVQAVVKDHRDKPCIPGTTLKGILRAWAKMFYPLLPALDRIFGKDAFDDPTAESGWAEFGNALLDRHATHDYAKYVPYWHADTFTGVSSNVCIDRVTGTAAKNKLFFQEFVPEGVTFRVELHTNRLTPAEVVLLLAVLEHGAEHESHPYQFGANGADGWGRVRWKRTALQKREPGQAWTDATLKLPMPTGSVPHTTLTLTLNFQGPFLVNDTSRVHREENDGLPHFTPLRKPDGTPWFPASSFRGALRARAEFLDLSRNGVATDSIERLFGTTSRASRLTIREFEAIDPGTYGKQDFNAIDRFTGGAADGALFTAEHVLRPVFKTRLTFDGLEPEDEALLAAALREVCAGRLTFGHGGSKGYGEARGTVDEPGDQWIERHLIAATPTTAPASAPLAAVVPPQDDANLKTGQLLRKVSGKTVTFALKVTTKKGTAELTGIDVSIPASLKTATEFEIDVEYEPDAAGRPKRIRRKGEQWATSPNTGWFAHPYYFLSLHNRDGWTGELADTKPRGHDRYRPGTFSGTIRVRLTTETPLVLCDTTKGRECPADQHPDFPPDTKKGHKVYPVPQRDGQPVLPASSVRGMLRAAYEAITNSRFGVFPCRPSNSSRQRLGYRPPAASGISTVPVRIETVHGQLMARLLPGTSRIGADGRALPGDPVYAACVARYDQHWTLPNSALVRHGHGVWAYIGPWQHTRFRFWNVETIVPSVDQPTADPNAQRFRPPRRTAGPSNWDEPHWRYGWLCVTERNIDGKHDERFFFESTAKPRYAAIDPTVAANWTRLIEDYQNQHKEELQRGITRPTALQSYCRFSRQITHDLKSVATVERELTDGTLCYAAVTQHGAEFVITALYPVMISRKLYEKTPYELLPPNLRPATTEAELSPADRVFGWVSQNAETDATAPAHRSHVRIGTVECVTEDAIVFFKPPKALAILGEPKPQQGRFYLGKVNGHFSAVASPGASKEQAGYQIQNRIRGPKVYPHHQNFDEAHATANERSNQNRSVEGWVKKGIAFEFDLHVTNLSRFELGALLWLLTLPDGHFLRLGLGKPLGFGSVRAEIIAERTCLADGADWASQIGSQGAPSCCEWRSFVTEFEQSLTKEVPKLLTAFKTAAKGWADPPIHYPYAIDPKTGNKELYLWFAENEGRHGKGHALPDLSTTPPTLPRDPTA